MKYSVVAIAAFAASTAAQLSPCGQMCVNNMLALAPSLGCPGGATDASCLCKNANFGYGIRDCANQACDTADAAAIIAYGNAYCASALGSTTASGGPGVTATTIVTVMSAAFTSTVTATSGARTGSGGYSAATAGPSSAGGATGSGGAGDARGPIAISTAAVITGIVSGSTTILSTIGSITIYSTESGATPILTVPIVSAVISGSSAFTTTIGSSTIYGAAGGTGGSSSTVPVVSTITSVSSTLITTVGDSTVTKAPSPTRTGSSSSSSSSGGASPQRTAAPVLIAAVGLAALLL